MREAITLAYVRDLLMHEAMTLESEAVRLA